MQLINVNEFEANAQFILNSTVYDYIASGAGDERTLKRNLDAFQQILIKPRILRGSNNIHTDINLLHHKLNQPLFISPLAFQCIVHDQGELATVAAANEFGIGMALSTMSSTVLEDIAKVATCPLWFQLYIHKDRSITRELIQRAESAGYEAIIITVDVPIMGRREKDIRNQFALPERVFAKNFSNQALINMKDNKECSFVKNYTDSAFDPALTWDDIELIQMETKLPIILKGIMHEEDAKRALDLNVAAIIISNHGGRQLDSMPASIEVLPVIAETIQGTIPILIDGGFRRGTDIFKAIALGADCIMIGRPILWALAVNGFEGLKTMLDIYKSELIETMILCGCSTIEDIKKSGINMIEFCH